MPKLSHSTTGNYIRAADAKLVKEIMTRRIKRRLSAWKQMGINNFFEMEYREACGHTFNVQVNVQDT
jgi:hypothetical protein